MKENLIVDVLTQDRDTEGKRVWRKVLLPYHAIIFIAANSDSECVIETVNRSYIAKGSFEKLVSILGGSDARLLQVSTGANEVSKPKSRNSARKRKASKK